MWPVITSHVKLLEILMFDTQFIGAAAVVLFAWLGMEMHIPDSFPLVAAATLGSLSSATIRIQEGYIKGFWPTLLAFITGLAFGWFVGKNIGPLVGFDGTALALPIFITATFGAKAVHYLSTKFDIASVIDGIAIRLKK